MCYRRTLVRALASTALTILVVGAALILSSPTFLCSVQTEKHCTGRCVWGCGQTCFCTTDDHTQASIGALILFFFPLPIFLACIWGCDDERLPRLCCCVYEDRREEVPASESVPHRD